MVHKNALKNIIFCLLMLKLVRFLDIIIIPNYSDLCNGEETDYDSKELL